MKSFYRVCAEITTYTIPFDVFDKGSEAGWEIIDENAQRDRRTVREYDSIPDAIDHAQRFDSYMIKNWNTRKSLETTANAFVLKITEACVVEFDETSFFPHERREVWRVDEDENFEQYVEWLVSERKRREQDDIY